MVIDYRLKSKTRIVQHMVLLHIDGNFSSQYSFEGFKINYDPDFFVLLTHYLFRLVLSNKSKWALLPCDLSAINFVLRHLRYMLTNLEKDDIQNYALENFFYKKSEYGKI